MGGRRWFLNLYFWVARLSRGLHFFYADGWATERTSLCLAISRHYSVGTGPNL